MSRKTNLPDPFQGRPLTEANFAIMDRDLPALRHATSVMLDLYELGTEGERILLRPVLLVVRKLVLAKEFKQAKNILMTAQRLALTGGHHNRVRETLDILADKALEAGEKELALDAQARAMKAFNIRPKDLHERALRHISEGQQALKDSDIRLANRVLCRVLRISSARPETYRLGLEILDQTDRHGDTQTSLDVLSALRLDVDLNPNQLIGNLLTGYACWLKNEDGTALKPILPAQADLFPPKPSRPQDPAATIAAKKQAVRTFCRTIANESLRP